MKRLVAVFALAVSLSAFAPSACAQESVGKAVSLPSDFPVPSIAEARAEVSEDKGQEGSGQPESSDTSAGTSLSGEAFGGADTSSGSSSDLSGGGDRAESDSPPSEPAHEHSWTIIRPCIKKAQFTLSASFVLVGNSIRRKVNGPLTIVLLVLGKAIPTAYARCR